MFALRFHAAICFAVSGPVEQFSQMVAPHCSHNGEYHPPIGHIVIFLFPQKGHGKSEQAAPHLRAARLRFLVVMCSPLPPEGER